MIVCADQCHVTSMQPALGVDVFPRGFGLALVIHQRCIDGLSIPMVFRLGVEQVYPVVFKAVAYCHPSATTKSGGLFGIKGFDEDLLAAAEHTGHSNFTEDINVEYWQRVDAYIGGAVAEYFAALKGITDGNMAVHYAFRVAKAASLMAAIVGVEGHDASANFGDGEHQVEPFRAVGHSQGEAISFCF